MSDFGDVEFFENIEEMSGGTPLAPDGEHNAKVIVTDKYKSQAGNWTLKVTMFTRLTKAVGFKKYPENHSDFVGKNLRLKLEQVDDSFEGDTGTVQTKKTKIRLYLQPEDADMSPPKEAEPPF